MKRSFHSNNNGVALITVMILVILLTILASALLSLQTNQVRLVEHANTRTESRYADEAAMVRTLELLRKNITPEATHTVGDIDIDISYEQGTGPNGTGTIETKKDFSVMF